jgi:hypothetical protein
MRDKISFVLQEKSTTARILAGVVGKIISLIPALGSVCQLMIRNSCIAICERNTWDSKFEYSGFKTAFSCSRHCKFFQRFGYQYKFLLICWINKEIKIVK